MLSIILTADISPWLSPNILVNKANWVFQTSFNSDVTMDINNSWRHDTAVLPRKKTDFLPSCSIVFFSLYSPPSDESTKYKQGVLYFDSGKFLSCLKATGFSEHCQSAKYVILKNWWVAKERAIIWRLLLSFIACLTILKTLCLFFMRRKEKERKNKT